MKSPLHILHLEDNPNDARLVVATLKAEGISYATTRVETQDDFVAALENGGIDLILSDFTLPEFDGLSALGIARDKCPDVPFIFVSGTLGEEQAIDSLENGATDYVLKEHLNRLAPAVRRAMLKDEILSEHRRIEEALRDSEAKYRGLFESSPDAIMTIEPPSWRFTSGNPATVKMFNAKNEEDFLTRAPWELSPERQPDGLDSAMKARKMIEKAMSEGTHRFEWMHRRISGEEFPASVL